MAGPAIRGNVCEGRTSPPLKLSTKCRQLEGQKWGLPKKVPFLHRLYCERGLPSPLALSPCESELFCTGLSTVRGADKSAHRGPGEKIIIAPGMMWEYNMLT